METQSKYYKYLGREAWRKKENILRNKIVMSLNEWENRIIRTMRQRKTLIIGIKLDILKKQEIETNEEENLKDIRNIEEKKLKCHGRGT